MKSVRKIRVEELSEEVLQAVVRHQGMKVMRVEDVVLSTVDPDLMTRALNMLEDVGVGGTKMTLEQWKAMLTTWLGGQGCHQAGKGGYVQNTDDSPASEGNLYCNR